MAEPVRTTGTDGPWVLEDWFPWLLDIPPEEMLAIITKLLSVEDGMLKGSSFIYDAGAAPEGMRRLWLSDASLRRLERESQ